MLRSSGQGEWAFNLRYSFPPDCLDEFGRIFSDDAISPGALEQHFKSFQIVVSSLRRDLLDQRISESHNILLCDLAYRLIGTIAKEMHKLVQAAAVKDHRGSGGLRFLGLQPVV